MKLTGSIIANEDACFVIPKQMSPEVYSGTNVTLKELPRYPVNKNATGLMQMFPPIW